MPRLPDTPCYLDGEYTRVCDAKVSVLDRGFIFGDGIYEVVPVYGRRLFRFDEHMARLQRSLTKVRIDNPHTPEDWLQRCRRLVQMLAEQTAAEDQLVYIQVTRGVAVRDYLAVRFDLPQGRLLAEGRGELEPIAGNDTLAGRQANRRVEIYVRP